MKQIYKVIKTVILLFALLGVSGNVWGELYGKAEAEVSPSNAGSVRVSYNNSSFTNWSTTTASNYGKEGGLINIFHTFTMAFQAEASNAAYEFLGWFDNSSGTGTAVSANLNMTKDITALKTNGNNKPSKPATLKYYAVFKALPTFYFKAEANTNNSTYGNAYVTFTEADKTTATTTTATTNCYGEHYYSLSSAPSAKTAYFRAVTKSGYVFKGWSTDNTEANIFNTNASITYDLLSSSKNSSSPTPITYYAIFGEKFAPQITGSTNVQKKVGASYTADFAFSNTSTAKPTTNSDNDFYYTVSHVLSTSINNGTDVISYDPTNNAITALNAGEATITFYHKSTATHQSTEVSFTIVVTKNDPTITWASAPFYYNKTVNNFYSSNNKDTQISAESNNTEVATIDGTTFKTYNKSGTVRITVTQVENYYWAYHQEYKDITPQKVNKHVQFTVNQDVYYVLIDDSKSSGSHTWDAGVRVGDLTAGAGFNWDDKSIVLGPFEGIPDKLSGMYSCTDAASGREWKIYESANGTSWGDAIMTASSAGNVSNLQLQPTTRYLKFLWSGNFSGYFSNMTVTELQYFKTATTSLDFQMNQLNHSPEAQAFVVKHANAGYQTEVDAPDHYLVSLDNTNFSSSVIVSTNATAQTGGDIMDEFTVYVKYLADAEGTHDGNVVVSNNLRTNISVPVTGTTQGKLATHINYIGNDSYPADTTNIAASALFEVRDANSNLVPNAVITLKSNNNNALIVNNNEMNPECGGSVTITASYAGDDTYEKANDQEKEITINKLEDNVQIYIPSVVVVGDEFDLATLATATSGTDITYLTSNAGVLKLENDRLIVKSKGNGSATLRATSDGDCTYESSFEVAELTIRRPEDPCNTLLLDSAHKVNLGAYGCNLLNPKKYEIANGPKDILTYKVWKYSNATQDIHIFITTQDIEDAEGLVREIASRNGNILREIVYHSNELPNSKEEAINGSVDMKEDGLQDAKYIYAVATDDKYILAGTLYKYISNVKITQQCYLTAKTLTPATMPTVTACDTAKAQFDLDYSDLGPIRLTSTADEQLTYEVWQNGQKLNDFDNRCGEWGTYTVKLFYVPLTAGDYSHTVTLSASGKSQTVTISGTATAAKREIEWNVPAKNTITATQSANILTAFAKTDCVNPAGEVAYTISPASAVTVSGTTVTFNQPIDKVTITANTTSSSLYGAADAVTKEWKVSKIGVTMQALPTITSTITCGDDASVVTYTDNWKAVNTLNGAEVAGSIRYDSPASFTSAGTTNLMFTFIPNEDALYETIQFNVHVTVAEAPVLPTEYVFTGEGSWETESGWNTHSVPEQNVDIKVTGQLIIDKEYEVKSLTIEGNGSVTTVESGKLTVNADSKAADAYGGLYVKEGGEVVLNGTLQVRDFVIASTTGSTNGSSASGQVENIDELNVNGDTYIDITFAPMNLIDDVQWYGFALPFEVDAINGVYRFEGSEVKKVTNMVNYAIAQYSAAAHYAGKTAWSYCKGTLRAGEFYMFTTDGVSNTYRFKKNKSAAKQGTTSLSLKTCGEGSKGNWNALGNATLTYVNASFTGGEFAQVYKNGYSSYMAVSTHDVSFVVGCPFFVQATKEETLTLVPVSDTRSLYYAPRRATAANASDKYKIQIAADGESFSDQIFVSASEDAANEYEVGRDLRKAGTGTKCAQLWVNAYNEKLCVNEAVMTNNQAVFDLTLYAPKSGEYTITLAEATDNGTLYLTQNGVIIWDLSKGAYVAELTKGNNTEYGLWLAAKAPQVTTDIDAADAATANAQKMIVNGQLFVLKDGVLYDATGKKVR